MSVETKYTVKVVSELCQVTIRTLRYYDNIGLVCPMHNESSGARLYTQKDIIKLQEVLTLKLIGFSLNEIKSILENKNKGCFYNKLEQQMEALEQQAKNLDHIISTIKRIRNTYKMEEVSCDEVMEIITAVKSAEISMKQYKDISNLNSRIGFHEKYSNNNQIGWYEWCFEKMRLKSGMKILEVGCGNGLLWIKNKEHISGLDLTVTDIEEEMVNTVANGLSDYGENIKYEVVDVCNLPYPDNTYDIVIANHMMYHVDDIDKALSEINRVTKRNSYMYFTTIGEDHLKELKETLDEIDLGKTREQWSFLRRFNLETGYELLKKQFEHVECSLYYDYLIVDKVKPIIRYVQSMEDKENVVFKGKRLKELQDLLRKKILMNNGFFITKEIGIIIVEK